METKFKRVQEEIERLKWLKEVKSLDTDGIEYLKEIETLMDYAHSCEQLPSYNELHIEMKKLSDKLHTDAKQTEKIYFEAGFNYCHNLLDERLNK